MNYAPATSLREGIGSYFPNDIVGAIDISVVGPKGISGQLAVAAGKAPPPNQPIGTLVVNIADDVTVGAHVFQIVGKAKINDKTVTKLVHMARVVAPGMPNPPQPPWNVTTSLGLAVTAKPPFALTAKLDAASYMPGKAATLTITATRAPGFVAEIALSAAGLPAGVTAMLKNLPANQNEIKIPLTLTPQVKPGQAALTITGKSSHQGQQVTASAPPVMLVIKK